MAGSFEIFFTTNDKLKKMSDDDDVAWVKEYVAKSNSILDRMQTELETTNDIDVISDVETHLDQLWLHWRYAEDIDPAEGETDILGTPELLAFKERLEALKALARFRRSELQPQKKPKSISTKSAKNVAEAEAPPKITEPEAKEILRRLQIINEELEGLIRDNDYDMMKFNHLNKAAHDILKKMPSLNKIDVNSWSGSDLEIDENSWSDEKAGWIQDVALLNQNILKIEENVKKFQDRRSHHPRRRSTKTLNDFSKSWQETNTARNEYQPGAIKEAAAAKAKEAAAIHDSIQHKLDDIVEQLNNYKVDEESDNLPSAMEKESQLQKLKKQAEQLISGRSMGDAKAEARRKVRIVKKALQNAEQARSYIAANELMKEESEAVAKAKVKKAASTKKKKKKKKSDNVSGPSSERDQLPDISSSFRGRTLERGRSPDDDISRGFRGQEPDDDELRGKEPERSLSFDDVDISRGPVPLRRGGSSADVPTHAPRQKERQRDEARKEAQESKESNVSGHFLGGASNPSSSLTESLTAMQPPPKSKTFDDELLHCPITSDLMTDPVMTADGQTYERSAIETWLKNNNTSPLTGNQLADKRLMPNRLVKKLIADYQERQN